MIQIQLNGHPSDIPENLNLAQLLRTLQVNTLQMAVAINLEVIVRSEMEKVPVKAGDEIEIFHAVGGG